MNGAEFKVTTFLLGHLPPIQSQLSTIRVPWLGGNACVTSWKFSEIPALLGYDMAELERGEFGSHTDEEGLGFLQHWLFLGLLQEALGEPLLDPNHWICQHTTADERHQRYMMSPYLPDYISLIQTRCRDRQDRPRWEHWVEVLSRTSKVVDALDMRFAQRCKIEDAEQHDSLKITWSIYMLGQILSLTIMTIYDVDDPRFARWPAGALLYYRLTQRLECPRACNRIASLFGVEGIYVMSLLAVQHPDRPYNSLPKSDRPEETREIYLAPHNLADIDAFRGIGRHWQCTRRSCLGEQIVEHLYEAVHHPAECRCEPVGPDVQEVIEILDASEVPAFIVSASNSNGRRVVSVKVVRANSSAYVAISHVWADGLGNKAHNKLPGCQAERIARLTESLTGRKGQPFWIDTFGIPRNLEERKKALNVMDVTYRNAEKVLVLDGGLQRHTKFPKIQDDNRGRTPAETNSESLGVALELSLRLLRSSWSQRLWTLPEGMLGPELHIQFSDGSVELGDLVAQLLFARYTSTIQDIINNLFLLRPQLRTQPRMGLAPLDERMKAFPQGNTYGRFIAMFHALEFRNSSWKEDEATCLGIHLGLDVPLIVRRDESERLEAFFAQLDTVPADLVFTHGDRIPRYPYRWAPLHLLEYKDNYLIDPGTLPKRPVGVRTDRGLLVEFDHYQLYLEENLFPNTTVIYFSIRLPSGYNSVLSTSYGMSRAAPNGQETENWTNSRTSRAFGANKGAILDLHLILGLYGVPGPPGLSKPGQIGLLLRKCTEEDGVTFCEPLDTVVVHELPSSGPVKKINDNSFVHWNAQKLTSGRVCIG